MEIGVVLDSATAWNNEYGHPGIPSSHRAQPSGALRWALANLSFLTDGTVESAVDLGCGTGRNAVALLRAGLKRVDGMDFSATALDIARRRPESEHITFIQGDVVKPLPYEDNSFDFASDIFVYFHQLADVDRAAYRREIHRVLSPGGIMLVSLATDNDGYYSSCATGPLASIQSSARLVWDPAAEVGNIMLSRDQLEAEFADLFSLQMSWTKRKRGLMHGKRYMRETVATLWIAKDEPTA